MLADKSDYNCSFMPISKVYLGAKMKDDEERRKIAKICDEKGIPVTCVMPKQDEFIMQDCLRKPGCLLEKNRFHLKLLFQQHQILIHSCP